VRGDYITHPMRGVYPSLDAALRVKCVLLSVFLFWDDVTIGMMSRTSPMRLGGVYSRLYVALRVQCVFCCLSCFLGMMSRFIRGSIFVMAVREEPVFICHGTHATH